MSPGTPVKVRRLSDGDCTEALQMEMTGRLVELEFTSTRADHGPGDLIEVESGDLLWFGEVLERKESAAIVCVEHSINRGRLPSLEEIWG